MRSQLRPHQTRAIERLRAEIAAGKRRVIVQGPTGFGKTKLAAAIFDGALGKGNRVVFCVPAISLIDQTYEEFYAEGITNVGIIQANHWATDWSKPVQIASVQTLERRDALPDAQLVVIDEAHRAHKFVHEWMARPEWAHVPFVGLSATPWTRGLGKHWQSLVIAATTAELIAQGWLSPFKVFAPAHPDLSNVRTVAGDYHEGELGAAMNDRELVADIVSTWLELGEGRPTLAFAVDRAHAKAIQSDFEAAGVRCGYIDAYTDNLERAAIKRAFHAGDLKIVASVGCLTTGLDWDVRCIIFARPTQSEILFTQVIGRGLRTAPGKDHLVILDHADNHARLGFVTDIHHATLDMGKGRKAGERKRKERLPKECAECSFLMPVKTRVCPNCGRERIAQADIEVREGELAEMSDRFTRPTRANAREWTMAEKQAWYSGFLHVAKERGYKPGWAANQYRERFDCWPHCLSEVPKEPCAEQRSWIKSRMIAYIKRKKAERAAA